LVAFREGEEFEGAFVVRLGMEERGTAGGIVLHPGPGHRLAGAGVQDHALDLPGGDELPGDSK
jgi:hypothetical protein